MSLHIAVIEDDLPIAQMYRFKLEADGFKVSVAHDGKQGLLLAEDIKPDLILLDLMMPVLTGSEMLEKLRQTKGGSKIRVIVLTNVSKNEAPHNLRFLNVDRYIVKAHYTPQQVIDVVREVLNIPQK